MNCNVGGVDRVPRIVAGLAILAAGVAGPLGWWGAIGLVPLATGVLRYCPAYSIFGVRTCAPDGRVA